MFACDFNIQKDLENVRQDMRGLQKSVHVLLKFSCDDAEVRSSPQNDAHSAKLAISVTYEQAIKTTVVR